MRDELSYQEVYDIVLDADPDDYEPLHFLFYGDLVEYSWRKAFEKYTVSRRRLEDIERKMVVSQNMNVGREAQRLLKQDVKRVKEDVEDLFKYLDLALDQEFKEDDYGWMDFEGVKSTIYMLDDEVDDVGVSKASEDIAKDELRAYNQFKEVFKPDRQSKKQYYTFEEYFLLETYIKSLLSATGFED